MARGSFTKKAAVAEPVAESVVVAEEKAVVAEVKAKKHKKKVYPLITDKALTKLISQIHGRDRFNLTRKSRQTLRSLAITLIEKIAEKIDKLHRNDKEKHMVIAKDVNSAISTIAIGELRKHMHSEVSKAVIKVQVFDEKLAKSRPQKPKTIKEHKPKKLSKQVKKTAPPPTTLVEAKEMAEKIVTESAPAAAASSSSSKKKKPTK